MLTQAQMEENGTRIRTAMEVLALRWPTNPQPADFLYLYSLLSNFLVLLEQDYGVLPGVFGSHGFTLPVINPASGDLEAVQLNQAGLGAAGRKVLITPPEVPSFEPPAG